MKKLLILLFLSYVCSDKLDLTYLPPPGSQYSGGRPEDIQTPLEFPKHTYSPTFRPQSITKGQETLGSDVKPTIGINREVLSKGPDDFVAPGSRAPINKYQRPINPPSTTTSFAFSQTTTYPPSENYETTQTPIASFPTSNNEMIPSGVSNLGYQQNQDNRNRPEVFGSKQQMNLFDNQKPTELFPDQQFATKYGSQQPPFFNTPSSVSRYPLSQSQRKPALIHQNLPQKSSISDQSDIGLVTGQISRKPFGPNLISNQTLNQSFSKRPTSTSSRISPEGYISSTLPSTYDTNNFERFTTIRPGSLQPSSITQTPKDIYQPSSEYVQNKEDLSNSNQSPSRQGQYQVTGISRIPQNQLKTTTEKMSHEFNQREFSADDQQQYPDSYTDDKFRGRPEARPKNTNRYPSNTSGVRYSKPQIPKQDVVSSKQYFDRPERPEAKLDRNAYIINYDSVITPEGYAYSYDTSNGIHADESGSTVDGTKAKGSYSYTGNDGKFYSVIYTADENGFRPYGDHLPTPPPIPEAIQRVIDKVKEEKEAGVVDDGSYSEEKYGHRQYHSRPTQKPKIPYHIDDNIVQDNKQKSSEVQSENQGLPSPKNNENIYKNNENIERGAARRPYDESSSRYRFPGKGVDQTKIGINQIPKLRPINGAVSGRPNIGNEIIKSSPNDDQSRPRDRYSYPGYSNQEGNDESLLVIKDRLLQNRPFYENGDDQNQKENIPTEFRGMTDEKQSFSLPFITMDDTGRPFNDEKNYRPESKFSTKRPFSKSTVKIINHDIADDKTNDNDELSSSRVPSKEYSTYYGNNKDQGDRNQSPVKAQFRGDKRPISTQTSNNQIVTKTRRPYGPGLTVNENEGLIEDQTDFNNNEYGTTPYYEVPKADYESSTKEVPESGQQNIKSKKPAIFSTKFADAGPRYRPQGSDHTYYGIDNTNEKNINKIATTSPSTRGNIQQQIHKTGYEYIPPRSMFYDENDKKQLPGNRPAMLPKRPSQKLNYFGNVPTGKPQTSLDYSKATDKIPGNKYNNEGVPNYGGPFDQSQNKLKPSEEAYESENPVQISQQQSSEYGAPKGILRPAQIGSDLYTADGEYEENIPVNRVSATLKPTPSYYGTTQMNIIVPSENLGNQNIPEYNLASPSTPFPTQESSLPTDTQAGEFNDRDFKYGSRIPSTTYRPKYKILRNNTSSITPGNIVDMYGRPISTGTLQDYENEYTESPNEALKFENTNEGLRPASKGERFQPTSENIKGNIPQFQYTTGKIIGEDFSGPKQPQRFDPKTGYHYK